MYKIGQVKYFRTFTECQNDLGHAKRLSVTRMHVCLSSRSRLAAQRVIWTTHDWGSFWWQSPDLTLLETNAEDIILLETD